MGMMGEIHDEAWTVAIKKALKQAIERAEQAPVTERLFAVAGMTILVAELMKIPSDAGELQSMLPMVNAAFDHAEVAYRASRMTGAKM